MDVVVFDKDNTLTAPYENDVHPDASLGLQSALLEFGKDRVAILSNSAGTKDDPGYKAAISIEEALGINVIRHNEKKPGGLSEVMEHFALRDPAKICIVGDRLLTDVVFGNLHGMLTVHTLPLCKGKDNRNDNMIASVVRLAENTLLYSKFGSRFLQTKRMTHKYWPGEQVIPLLLNSSSNNHGK